MRSVRTWRRSAVRSSRSTPTPEMRCDGKKYSGEPACPQVTRLKSKTSFRFIRFLQCKHRGSVRGTFIWTYGAEDWFFLNTTYADSDLHLCVGIVRPDSGLLMSPRNFECTKESG